MLRDEIAEILMQGGKYVTLSKWADEILALVDQHYLNEKKSDLVTVRECEHTKVFGASSGNPCPTCRGTGRIVRELSVAEAVEWANDVAVYFDTPLPPFNMMEARGELTKKWGRVMRKEDL